MGQEGTGHGHGNSHGYDTDADMDMDMVRRMKITMGSKISCYYPFGQWIIKS
jgi:hypothetical protein